MLIDSQKLKSLRGSRNWTQQHLADVCALSLRTIQRVERDGVASHETISAYASVFELDFSELIISKETFEGSERAVVMQARTIGLIIFGSFAAGVICAMWLV